MLAGETLCPSISHSVTSSPPLQPLGSCSPTGAGGAQAAPRGEVAEEWGCKDTATSARTLVPAPHSPSNPISTAQRG